MRLIFSSLHIKSLLVSCAYVSIELIDGIILLSFELIAIFFISLVKAF